MILFIAFIRLMIIFSYKTDEKEKQVKRYRYYIILYYNYIVSITSPQRCLVMYKHMLFTHLYLSMLLSVIETSIYLNLLSTLHKQSVDPHTYYHNYFIILLRVDIKWLELSYPSLFSLTLICAYLCYIQLLLLLLSQIAPPPPPTPYFFIVNELSHLQTF